MKIILASASPRRAELLSQFGIPFEVQNADIDEEIDIISPETYVRTLSWKKAEKISSENPDAIVIGADTTVVLNDEIINKPKDKTDAFNMLRKLSGKEHKVYTGLTVMDFRQTITESLCTSVFFKPVTDNEIEAYIATGEPLDKAGAYGIQGFGGLFIDKIDGCYFNVVGLPLSLLYNTLKKFNIHLL